VRGLPAYGVQRRANSLGVLRQGTVSGGASPLLTDLAAYWKLDETSGTRFDSVGTNHLTDNGSVGYGIGKQSNAALFDGTNYLTTASQVLSGTGSFSAFGWFLTTDTTIRNQGIFGQTNFGGGWTAVYDNNDLYFDFNSSRERFTGVIAQDTYYFIGLIHDSSTNTTTFYLDNTELGTLAGGFAQENQPVRVGRQRAQDDFYLVGRVDEVGLWGRVLMTAEIATLYNGGAGITYPFV
jgi:hypothetical protein